jgi:predicted RNase H-like nuclease
MDPVHFVGIDLAWSQRNSSGVAALRYSGDGQAVPADESLPAQTFNSDQEILDYVKLVAGQGSVVIAVDAPLKVPNETGSRRAEKELADVFSRFDAMAYPSNRKNLGKYNHGEIRGEVLVKKLAALRVEHDPKIAAQKPTRQVFEVYPHPAMVVLFDLKTTLKYKARPKRTRQEREKAFREYQHRLRDLREATPAAHFPADWLGENHLNGSARALKQYEDACDAAFCAYLAFYYWWWGEARCTIFGTLNEGYIVSPVDDRVLGR